MAWVPGWKCGGSEVSLRSSWIVTPTFSSMVSEIHSIMWGDACFSSFYIKEGDSRKHGVLKREAREEV